MPFIDFATTEVNYNYKIAFTFSSQVGAGVSSCWDRDSFCARLYSFHTASTFRSVLWLPSMRVSPLPISSRSL